MFQVGLISKDFFFICLTLCEGLKGVFIKCKALSKMSLFSEKVCLMSNFHSLPSVHLQASAK